MLRPFRWKVLEYWCSSQLYIKELLKCISVFQHCRFSQNQGKERADRGGEGAAFIISAFSVQILLFFPPSTFRERPTRTKTIQRRRHIGSINLLYSLKPPCCGGGSLLGITVQQNCYSKTATATLLISLWTFLSFALGGGLDALQDVLVNPLEALRVFHRHEELLSKVFKWLVGRQIQAVKTAKKENDKWINAIKAL